MAKPKTRKRKRMGRPPGSTKFGEELTQVAFRFRKSTIEQLDAYAEHMKQRDPARGATRADAVRELLDRALAAFERRQQRNG